MFHAAHGYQKTPSPEAQEPGPAPEPGATHTATALATAPAERRTGRTSAPPAPAGSTKPAGRDPYFDNAKYLAIVLVAVAHAWEPVMDGSRAARALYMIIYTFHMPAFILISGYFSRSYQGKPHQIRRLLTGIALPYVVFEVAYSLFAKYAGGDSGQKITLLDPYYLTWFLAALFIWRLTTPLWRVVKWPLPIALAIAVAAALTPGIGADLNLQRVLQFLPFFVLGLCMKPEHFRMLRRREVKLLTLPLLAGTALFAYWLAPDITLRWFYRSSAVQDIGTEWWSGALIVLGFFGCAAVLTAAFLAWVPSRQSWMTALGAGTICGYLLHGFVVKACDYLGVFAENDWLSGPIGLVTITLVMAGVVTLLCTPPVRRLMRPVTEPDMAWAFRKEEPAKAGAAR
ncbi:acyltransferase family protein [Streptomyces sp. NPDC005805]|uniref:acyltransferase family protein n=1 Tax=Streptomyces sp. NPDC005805 TaxID=3157068 RepID=UPI0033C0B9D5